MVDLTIFTPTFNRENTLVLGYEALKSQTCKDFIWLIIDDGSTDNTSMLVEKWKKIDNGFEIQYVYKENGGLHTGYNKAIELISTELCVCIDSDDYMPDNAVELILNFWLENKSDDIAGFIGRDSYTDGTLIGGKFPSVNKVHITELEDKYGFRGDTKMVLRTDLLKKVAPQPTYNDEKNFNPIYLMLLLDNHYEFKLFDRTLCFVEYDQSGMSCNILKQYYNSPNSFAALRIVNINSPYISFKRKMRHYIHLGSSILISKNMYWLKQAPSKILLMVSFPLSILLYVYILIKK